MHEVFEFLFLLDISVFFRRKETCDRPREKTAFCRLAQVNLGGGKSCYISPVFLRIKKLVSHTLRADAFSWLQRSAVLIRPLAATSVDNVWKVLDFCFGSLNSRYILWHDKKRKLTEVFDYLGFFFFFLQHACQSLVCCCCFVYHILYMYCTMVCLAPHLSLTIYIGRWKKNVTESAPSVFGSLCFCACVCLYTVDEWSRWLNTDHPPPPRMLTGTNMAR